MLFTSPLFLFTFLPLTLLAYYGPLRRSRPLQNLLLLLVSLVFYGYGEPEFIKILIASVFVNWAAGWVVGSHARFRRFAMWGSVAANVGLLFYFKYLAFGVGQINACFGTAWRVPDIVLPLGISFFTFQAMSYVLDIYQGKSRPQRNPLDVGLYIVLFPQLVAGPIVRYETVADEIRNRRETWSDFARGLCRFAVGFGKKVLLANPLAIIADTAFDGANWIPLNSVAPGAPFSTGLAWTGIVAYTFQIFFDFSGYSDMAIGMGRMFGFHFLENFDHPYVSRSVSEFWRRWHISMGTWFRDYVYFPLGGSRSATRARNLLNLFVVWTLTGIWHGANWTFLAWGLMYFALIACEKLLRVDRRAGAGALASMVGWAYTMFFVMVGWVFFRATSLAQGWRYFGALFGRGVECVFEPKTLLLLSENAVFLVCAVLFSMPMGRWSRGTVARFRSAPPLRIAGDRLYASWIVGILVVSVSYLAKGAHNPFIYFNF